MQIIKRIVYLFVFISLPFCNAFGQVDTSAKIILKGKIVTASSNAPIPYANIGIPAGECGTVANNDGNFILSVPATLANNNVRISSVGYVSKIVTVNELVKQLIGQPVIALVQQDKQLNEVTISAKKPKIRIVGNTTKSKSLSVGFPLKDLGSEMGVKISLGKKLELLQAFNFTVAQMKMDSCTFRFNIYELKDDQPAENLFSQNILIGISKPGTYTINLKPYKLVMKEHIFISLEWIDGKTASNTGNLFFSASLFGSCYHRKTTEAKWIAFPGLGTGFNLQVEQAE